MACLLQAQGLHVFSSIDSNNGLSENRIRCISQLSDGRMVIMTDGVANLYDGTTFRYLHFNDQNMYLMPDYEGFHQAYVDASEYMWVKEYKKLKIFDIKKEQFISNPDSILFNLGIKEQLSNIFMDSNHDFWFLTLQDELVFRNNVQKETSVFLSNVSQKGNKNDKLLDLAVHDNHVFLFFKSGVMICFDKNTQKELFRNNSIEGEKEEDYNQFISVVPYKNSFYMTRNGHAGIFLRYDIKKQIWQTILKQDYWFNTLSIDNKGNIRLSCRQGLWLIDQELKEKQHISELQLIDGRTFNTEINTHYCDQQGGLWLGSSNRGILYYHPERFKFRNIGRSLFDIPNNRDLRINCFAEYDNDILVGTPKGLFRYAQNSRRLTLCKEVPSEVDCQSLLKDQKGRIWLCAGGEGNGLYCFSEKKVKHLFPDKSVYYIYENPDGTFFVCLGDGLWDFDPETGTYKETETTKKLHVVYQVSPYEENSLIGVSDAGAFIYNRETDSLYIAETRQKERFPIFHQNNYEYHCVLTDSRGLIWLGTRDGLSVWNSKENRLRTFHTEDGLVNNRIQSIIEDDQHRIWVSTSNGISRIMIADDNQYSFANYNHYDGVITNEFRERASYKTKSGSLLWGGIDGFNELDLNNIDKEQQKLLQPLFVRFFLFGTEIRQGETYAGNVVLNQSITSTRELDLKYNQNSVTFEFSALNYINPTQTFYHFRLEGADGDWNEITTNDGIGRANYTNLPPGIYTLRVYAENNNKDWDQESAEIRIIINPPFWKTSLAYSLYLLFFLFSLYFSVFYYLKQNKKRIMRQQKEELDKMKFHFFTNISHELRTPLTLILTPLDTILKKTEEGLHKKQLTGIYHNANDLLRIVNQLLDFRKLEITGETLHLSYCNINEFIDSICSAFESLTENKSISFTRKLYTSDIFAYVDKDKLQKIVNNLLSNACKFTPKGGTISLELDKSILPDKSAEVFSIHVTDSGYGIPEKELSYIFERFYQTKKQTGQNTGSGIGLYLTQEYVQLHKGFIQVESQLNNGSIFTVHIPLNLQPAENNESPDNINEGRHTQKLLVVEDNDEFRNFLCDQLSGYYSIISASDGVEGIEKAIEFFPDLIISDVMMPQMDGIELCNRLKKDIRTSHIPIIILTAHSSDQAQIKGYQSGADAYISKPFNMDILLLRIQNLLEQLQFRKELFKRAIVIQPESITSTNVDEELIKKAIQCVEKNLNNPHYSVEQFSKDMNMDRTGLYRKLMAVVEQSPTAFIRSIRLKKAAQLLKQGFPVSEVADLVGFGTLSYFSKCFQEEFGVRPSQYSEI